MTNIKLISEFLNKAVKVRRFIEQTSSFEDKAVTLLQIQALKCINSNPKIPVGLLAKELSMSPSAIAQLSNRLVEAGFAKRENDSEDRRIISLTITPNGSKKIDSFTKQLLKTHFTIFTTIPDHDLKEMIRIFTNILESQNKPK